MGKHTSGLYDPTTFDPTTLGSLTVTGLNQISPLTAWHITIKRV